jgi:hypothetical protein
LVLAEEIEEFLAVSVGLGELFFECVTFVFEDFEAILKVFREI